MSTGLHIVRDVYCGGCEQYLGWTYVESGLTKEYAYVNSEKYKEDCFILEKAFTEEKKIESPSESID